MCALSVLSAACAAWAAGDLRRLALLVADDIVFDVNQPARVNSYLGYGRGKPELIYRLQTLLDDWAVIAFHPEWRDPPGPLWQCADIFYCYEARETRTRIEGTMRNHFRVVDGKIVQVEMRLDASLSPAAQSRVGRRPS
jgi:hypothetical protein